MAGAWLAAPRWARPAVAGAGGQFRIVLRRWGDGVAAALRRSGQMLPLSLGAPAPAEPDGLVACSAYLAPGTPSGLSDLLASGGARHCRERHAVCVPPEGVAGLTLAHCSDVHLLNPTAGHVEDRAAKVHTLVRRLNALRPDLAVITGDLISRYDGVKRPLPPDLIGWQIRWLRRHLSALQVPLLVCVENHDVAFTDTRPDWYAAMGGGLSACADDRSIDRGPYHLALPACYAHYDEHNAVTDMAFRPEQLAWLQSDLAAAPDGAVRLLLTHYDYRRQLPALFPVLRIDGLLYGHAQPLYPEDLLRYGIWDGHLPSRHACRVMHRSGRHIASQEAISWDALA